MKNNFKAKNLSDEIMQKKINEIKARIKKIQITLPAKSSISKLFITKNGETSKKNSGDKLNKKFDDINKNIKKQTTPLTKSSIAHLKDASYNARHNLQETGEEILYVNNIINKLRSSKEDLVQNKSADPSKIKQINAKLDMYHQIHTYLLTERQHRELFAKLYIRALDQAERKVHFKHYYQFNSMVTPQLFFMLADRPLALKVLAVIMLCAWNNKCGVVGIAQNVLCKAVASPHLANVKYIKKEIDRRAKGKNPGNKNSVASAIRYLRDLGVIAVCRKGTSDVFVINPSFIWQQSVTKPKMKFEILHSPRSIRFDAIPLSARYIPSISNQLINARDQADKRDILPVKKLHASAPLQFRANGSTYAVKFNGFYDNLINTEHKKIRLTKEMLNKIRTQKEKKIAKDTVAKIKADPSRRDEIQQDADSKRSLFDNIIKDIKNELPKKKNSL